MKCLLKTEIEIIAKAEEKDSQLMLRVIQNVEEKILREVSRMKKTFTIMEKLTSKYGDMNNDTEYWLKKLRKHKANDRSPNNEDG